MSVRVLLTGATGFVGSRVFPALVKAGFDVVCTSRDPARAKNRYPNRTWVRLNVELPETLAPAMEGVDVVIYLVHSIGTAANYGQVERASACAVRHAAAAAGVRHVVYLGGVEPEGPPSKHLKSRLETGALLREGEVPTTELRAGMIIGEGSESWQICSDLARLPAMILPQWLKTRSEPVAIDDVVAALTFAAGMSPGSSTVYDLPGPDVVTARAILERIAAAKGARPLMIEVPLLTPRLSSYWLRFVTRADYRIARELVAGLTSDLLARHETLWSKMPGFRPTSFDDAMSRAQQHP
jgi:uncharacterized protein YbjT (DUF2867 family)